MENIVLHRLFKSLSPQLRGEKVETVFDSRGGISLSLRAFSLFISLHKQHPGLASFRQVKRTSGEFSPVAGQLSRWLNGADLRGLEKDQADRIIKFTFQKNEAEFYLWYEAIPRRVDLILTDDAGQILYRFSDPADHDSYQPPPLATSEFNFISTSSQELLTNLDSSIPGLDATTIAQLKIAETGENSLKALRGMQFNLAIFALDNGQELLLPAFYQLAKAELLEEFVSPDDAVRSYLIRQLRRQELAEMQQALNKGLKKQSKRLKSAQTKIARDMEAAEKNKEIGKMGDLLLANMHVLKRGLSSIEVINYYDESGAEISIKLNPEKSPQENIDGYYKKARKAKRGKAKMLARLQELKKQLQEVEAYKSRVIENAADLKHLTKLEKELLKKNWLPKTAKGKKAPPRPPGRRFWSSDKMEIVVGRDNVDNETVTFKVGRENDFWLHTAGMPGSHVVVRNPKKLEEMPPRTAEEAAAVAAYYSKGRNSTTVLVHWTKRRFVKKIKGAPPGKVQLATYMSINIKPALPTSISYEKS
jgi:predicted ribosome quality control (RQC) complex YloA/Tae2 family protein